MNHLTICEKHTSSKIALFGDWLIGTMRNMELVFSIVLHSNSRDKFLDLLFTNFVCAIDLLTGNSIFNIAYSFTFDINYIEYLNDFSYK